ncbi:CRAL/TRIO domain-containing protein, putative [Eimeria tenella]|uniref:CRAL/TRIO domain-containing protein, putative n=1 Tax=Eimeria tenella TaxID=5802 RepID=U6KKQ7_EIMTE|nr:CRAL/TRIO domain-containing protein, putative [Eimeria tenella]CDJ38509.1 CRAL/TRIO domain-containing protein, putative [Eimeria tenella]|eukprot:XP_013229347.1 CRAL/TRIO domain-containing protein, putative [Eimeria tenella]
MARPSSSSSSKMSAAAAEPGARDAPCLGPPPVLNIYHAAAPGLSAAQQRRVVLLKKKIRAEHARLLKLKEAKLKELQQQQQQQQGKKGQQQEGAHAVSKEQQEQELRKLQQQQLQQQQLQQQQELTYPLTGFEVHWADDQQNLVRLLVARDWHVPRAFSLAKEALAIRRLLQPERIKPQQVKAAAAKGQLYRRGFDRRGHPLVYVRPALSEGAGAEAISLLVYTLERACQSQQRHAGVAAALCLLLDYNNYSNDNQPSLATALRFVQVFQCIYAEQLAAAFLVDTPWYFSTFWNCISPFLPSRTAAKIKFISTSNAEEVKQIFDAIDPKYVESWVPGGEATSKYDHEAYWEEENKQFETYMKFLQQEFFKKSMAQRIAEDAAFNAALASGKSIEEATEIARNTTADKAPAGATDDSATAETQDGEEEAEDTDDPDTPESLEDEQKRLLLQEALRKQEAAAAEAAAAAPAAAPAAAAPAAAAPAAAAAAAKPQAAAPSSS